MNINFNYESAHTLSYQNGYILPVLAMPGAKRLYVIWNSSSNPAPIPDRPVYVGTAKNVQERFDPRIEVIREMGFIGSQIQPISIFIVQITTDGKATPPNSRGTTKIGVDVELLLIRTYINYLGVNVRNMDKIHKQFSNTTGQTINWSLVNNCGIQNFGNNLNYTLAAGASL